MNIEQFRKLNKLEFKPKLYKKVNFANESWSWNSFLHKNKDIIENKEKRICQASETNLNGFNG